MHIAAILSLAFVPQPLLRQPFRAPVARVMLPPLALLNEPDEPLQVKDELKTRFARDEESPPIMRPNAAAQQPAESASPARSTRNEQLLGEIEALQKPKTASAPREKKEVDLNGIQPGWLLVGATSYAVFAALAWQFTVASAEFFEANPMTSSFYVVERLSSVARVVVVAMGALGTGVTAIAGFGQLLLAGRVAMGVASGELDPNAEREDPYGGRKLGELEKMLGFMKGDKNAGLDSDLGKKR